MCIIISCGNFNELTDTQAGIQTSCYDETEKPEPQGTGNQISVFGDCLRDGPAVWQIYVQRKRAGGFAPDDKVGFFQAGFPAQGNVVVKVVFKRIAVPFHVLGNAGLDDANCRF